MSYHYGEDYHNDITTAGEVNIEKRWFPVKKRILEIVPSGDILDLGCSSGGFLRTLKRGDWNLYGIEISSPQAQIAEAASGAKVFVGGILDAPFPADSFDVITGFHVLEHVYEPKAVITKVWHWLRPGGIFYLTLPNIESLDARIFGSYWYGLELPRHLFHFSPTSLRHLFASFHFEEVFLRTMPYNHIEDSIPYVIDGFWEQLGRSPVHQPDARKMTGLPSRLIRKAFRIGLLRPMGYLAAAFERGAGIEVMLRKPAKTKA